jgi:hypothetical protein
LDIKKKTKVKNEINNLRTKKNNDMLTKIRLKEQIDKFPDEFSIDELIEKLILIEKIESGNKQSKNGEIISEGEMENEIEKWFK